MSISSKVVVVAVVVVSILTFVKKIKNYRASTYIQYPTRREMRQIGSSLGGYPLPILHCTTPFLPI